MSPLTPTRFVGARIRPRTNPKDMLVNIFAYDRFKPGVTMDMITPLLPQEVANVWRLWKAGIVREK